MEQNSFMEKEINSKVKTAAGIVTDNPEIERLQENLKAASKQVDFVLIYDNASKNIDEIEKVISAFQNVRVIKSDTNKGVAGALNELSDTAISENVEWFLTLDHDSVIPENFIKACKSFVADNIGIICPVMYDKRRPQIDAVNKDKVSYVDFCITSGSFVNLSVWKQIGKYDEFLFVGLVDNEYCKRVILNGYKILRLNEMLMDHELGTLQPTRLAKVYKKLAVILHSKTIAALSYRRKVSPFRAYYATRNIVYLSKKYKNYPCYEFSKKFAIKNGLSNFIRSGFDIKVLKAVVKGFSEGNKIDVTDDIRCTLTGEYK